MKSVLDWLDARTQYRHLIHEALYERIPGGSRWRYVWGSTLVFAFVTQIITGTCLWMCYSPSSQTAWESVYYIQNEMVGGWLLRGIHHYTAQVMIVLLALHVLQVVIDGAYRAPREFNFWIGIILLQITLALGLTGYLLPWDQKGYWATKVATNIIALVPFVGTQLQSVVVGGSDYGHHTLTRFFALHAGVLPGLMILFIALHMYFFRRQGVHVKEGGKGQDCYFWPDQILKDVVACLGVLSVVLLLIFWNRITHGPGAHLGATLMAPADPAEPYSAARPDWYFLFLFQMLKLQQFKGHNEVWGAIYLPGLVIAFMALMPFIGHWKLGHRFNILFIGALLVGAGVLTGAALIEDATDPDYSDAVTEAQRHAERAVTLAQGLGIPPAGALNLLRDDPLTQGPKLFARYCASCHRYDGHDGTGAVPEDDPSASDLKDFADREWIAGVLDPARIDTIHYFGGTALRGGDMSEWVHDNFEEADAEKNRKRAAAVVALSAEAQLRSQRALDRRDHAEILQGRDFIVNRGAKGGLYCVRCHKFGDKGNFGRGPDLTGYGSRQWLIDFVSDPAHDRFYSEDNDRMPAFGRDEVLDAKTIGLVVDWLREDWFVPGEKLAEDDAVPDTPAPPAEKKTEPPAEIEKKPEPTTTPGEPATGEPATGEPATAEPTPGAGAEESNQPTAAAATDGEKPDFVSQVKPILENHCFKCHGGGKGKPKGKYRMDTLALALTPGDWGETPIVPGNASESYLYKLITSEDDDERMPPKRSKNPLSKEQVAVLGAWITAGAAWPDGVGLTMPPSEEKK